MTSKRKILKKMTSELRSFGKLAHLNNIATAVSQTKEACLGVCHEIDVKMSAKVTVIQKPDWVRGPVATVVPAGCWQESSFLNHADLSTGLLEYNMVVIFS